MFIIQIYVAEFIMKNSVFFFQKYFHCLKVFPIKARVCTAVSLQAVAVQLVMSGRTAQTWTVCAVCPAMCYLTGV